MEVLSVEIYSYAELNKNIFKGETMGIQKLLIVISFSSFIMLLSCSNQSKTATALSSKDINKIRAVNRSYMNGWLNNDTTAILDLFLNNATIIPSGLNPQKGRKELKEFWFPKDSSETVINKYEIEILDLQGSNDFAYTLEKGFLSFSYKKGDFSMSKETNAHATTVYRRQKNGEWKILTRMWTDIR
jgi:ketosteroid isomerase-like protein